MITEDYVSFETAKLLKDKGFNEVTSKCYLKYKGEYTLVSSIDVPTLQMAMKWLRGAHGLHVEPIPNCADYIHSSWFWEIIHLSDMSCDWNFFEHKKYATYEEACEAAIKYCLEMLII